MLDIQLMKPARSDTIQSVTSQIVSKDPLLVLIEGVD